MSAVTIYGIKNCSSMKKAFNWLDQKGIDYQFHDYKKQAVDEALVARALKEQGHDIVVNKRGTTWRKLDDQVKESMNNDHALDLIKQNPSLAKRPMLVVNDKIIIGFDEERYASIF